MYIDRENNPLEGLSIESTLKVLKKEAIMSAEYVSGDKTYVYKEGHCYDVNKSETYIEYIGRDNDSINFYNVQKVG
jgi:hypothetical protein